MDRLFPFTGAVDLPPLADAGAEAEAGAVVDDATAAAIGLALTLEAGTDATTSRRVTLAPGSPSAWAMAGRLRSLRR